MAYAGDENNKKNDQIRKKCKHTTIWRTDRDRSICVHMNLIVTWKFLICFALLFLLLLLLCRLLLNKYKQHNPLYFFIKELVKHSLIIIISIKHDKRTSSRNEWMSSNRFRSEKQIPRIFKLFSCLSTITDILVVFNNVFIPDFSVILGYPACFIIFEQFCLEEQDKIIEKSFVNVFLEIQMKWKKIVCLSAFNMFIEFCFCQFKFYRVNRHDPHTQQIKTKRVRKCN